MHGIVEGLKVVGEIQAMRDLTINGQVSGSVFMPGSELLIGPTADVHANVTARIIEVQGNVNGDLKASERIVIRNWSTVTGDVVSPQIQLEEGCRFKGSMQMREPDMKQKPPVRLKLGGGADGSQRETVNR